MGSPSRLHPEIPRARKRREPPLRLFITRLESWLFRTGRRRSWFAGYPHWGKSFAPGIRHFSVARSPHQPTAAYLFIVGGGTAAEWRCAIPGRVSIR